MMSRIRLNRIKLLGLLLIVALGVAGWRALGLSWSDLRPERVQAEIRQFGWWAWLAFGLLYGQPFLPLPASIMWMAAGLTFGLWGGLAAVLVVSTIRGCGQLLIARFFGREAVETLLKGRWAAWDARIGQRGFWAVFWIRLIPSVPFDLQNFGFGFSRVSLGAFAAGTMLGLIPNAFLWVCLGHALTDLTIFWTVLAVVAGILAIWWVWSRRYRRRLRVPS